MQRSSLLVLLLFLGLSASVVFAQPPLDDAKPEQQGSEPMEAAPSLRETRDFIFQKMAYDEQYFGRLAKYGEQGRRDPKMSKASFTKELSRARVNLPVLRRFAAEKKAYLDEDKPFTVPGRGALYREYRNLITLLNMFQAHRLGRADDVTRFASRVEIREAKDFGTVRGERADYYITMYRAYFYLVGSAYYARGQDARAVEWFARLEADANLAKLKDEIAKEEPNEQAQEQLRIEQLRTKPVALLPFANNTGDRGLDWVSSAVLEVLTVDLSRSSDLFLVERAQLDKVMEETVLALGGFVEPGQATKAGALTGAATLLVGALQKQGDGLLVTMRFVEAAGERVLAAAKAPTTTDEIFTTSRKLVLELFGQLGWQDSFLAEDLLTAHAPTAATARALYEARLLMSTKQSEARALYAKAMKEDPALANLYEDLKAEFKDLAATVAVMPFTSLSGRAEDEWMARGVMEALGTDLPQLDFNVVERTRVEDLLLERTAREAAALDASELQELGQALGANFAVIGSVLHHAPSVRVDARFVDVRTGLIVFATSAENKRDDLNAAIVGLTASIAERFNRPLDDESIDDLLASKLSAEDFERTVREQLSKESLAKSQRASAAAAEQETADGLDLGTVGFLASAVGLVGGAALATTSFLLAEPPAARAHELHGLQSVVPPGAAKDELMSARDQAALEANVWRGLGYAGTAVAALSTAWLVGQGMFALLDDEEAPAPGRGADGAERAEPLP